MAWGHELPCWRRAPQLISIGGYFAGQRKIMNRAIACFLVSQDLEIMLVNGDELPGKYPNSGRQASIRILIPNLRGRTVCLVKSQARGSVSTQGIVPLRGEKEFPSREPSVNSAGKAIRVFCLQITPISSRVGDDTAGARHQMAGAVLVSLRTAPCQQILRH